MRNLIAALKMSVDGKIEGTQGYADWVVSWADEFELTDQIDACVLGAGMYPNYEQYWTSVQQGVNKPESLGSGGATPEEVEWALFAEQTPHYVVSASLSSAQWPKTQFLRDLGELAELKNQQGKSIYLMGGARITASCLDAGLVDELRLIVYPIVVGEGMALFDTVDRRNLQHVRTREMTDGRVALTYRVA